MTLPVPKLDTRTYDELMAEALRRLPLYAPEYTNHNASDPGRAILEANAFLTETLLYQVNRVPDQNYVAFLNLLGIAPRPAEAARAELAFTLKDLKKAEDPLTVMLPQGTQVAVDDPALEEEIVFETPFAFRALNADIGTALVPQGTVPETWEAVTRFDGEERVSSWLHAFHPFGSTEAAGRQFLFALVLRPKADGETPEDRMPSGALDLFIEAQAAFATGADGAPINGMVAEMKGPLASAPDAPAPVTWEVFAASESPSFTFGGKTGWQPLAVTLDETEGLRRTGHLRVTLPEGMTGVRFSAVPAEVWEAMGRQPVPATKEALLALLTAPGAFAEELKLAMTEDTLLALGLTEDQKTGLLSRCATAADMATVLAGADYAVDPAGLSAEEWAALHPDFAAPDFPAVSKEVDGEKVQSLSPLYFFRATLRAPMGEARLLRRIRLNTVGAVAASTRREERLGTSNGRPGQSFALARTPVYIDPMTAAPDLVLSVVDQGVAEPWVRVAEFHGAGPADKVFVLDPGTGEVRFGDGRPGGIGGAIPPRGAQIVAARYRFGGGALGNVASGTITKIKGALTHVKGVTNPAAAIGGADAETLEQVKRRAPGTMRRRERAVTAEDFSELARLTPGAAIHKAYAVAAKVPDGDGFADKPGAVSVVVLPSDASRDPDRLSQTLREVRRWLDGRRLVSTELHVASARYFEITGLSARLRIASDADIGTVTAAAQAALLRWFDPIVGGEDGTGWPFGADIFHGDIYDVLLAVPGVDRVSRLSLTHDPVAGVGSDVVPVPEGYLPSLSAGAVGFEVSYD